MSDFVQVLRDMPLGVGAHTIGEGACVMEKVAILWGCTTAKGWSGPTCPSARTRWLLTTPKP